MNVKGPSVDSFIFSRGPTRCLTLGQVFFFF